MGILGFLDYVERNCQQACVRVDLGQLARKRLNNTGKRGRALVGQDPLLLIIDADSCLHRLYGGSFTDWVCGGQWNSMFHFIDNLARASRSNNMKLIVIFNGSLEKNRITDWFRQETQTRNTVGQVLGHVHNKGTPPPKAWFTPPVALDTCIRLALHQCGIQTVVTCTDHTQEVIAYLRQRGCHGILGQSADLAIFDPPMLFSSHRFKLSMKGEITTQQYNMEEVARALNLHPDRFVLFAALLGNHIMPEEDLAAFHWSLLGPDHPLNGLRMRAHQPIQPPLDAVLPLVAGFVRNITNMYDLDAIGQEVFRTSKGRLEEKIQRFKASVEFYWRGTKDAWTRHRGKGPRFNFRSSKSNTDKSDMQRIENALSKMSCDDNEQGPKSDEQHESSGNGPSTQSHQDIPSLMEQPAPPYLPVSGPPLPMVPRELVRIAKHRHDQGLMAPQVLQVLTSGEIKLGVILEDELSGEFPPSVRLFRPIRQKIYGILYSFFPAKDKLMKKDGSGESQDDRSSPPIVIREWYSRRDLPIQKADLVEALPLDLMVPPLTKLWLGREPEDKNFRLRAFLSCLNSDLPSMHKTACVPKHALILCCVVRYLLHSSPPLLRKHELDAILAQSVSPILNNPTALQELKIPNITARGVQLAALFMRGVEMAIFANDACGAPIPWDLCCPWLYFDGKLFQYKLHKAMTCSSLKELCDGKMDQVGKVERMKQCILEGVMLNFRHPMIPQMGPPAGPPFPGHEYYYNFRQGGGPMPPMPMGPMGRGKRQMNTRGGQLEVAGMVTGQWAGTDGSRPRGGLFIPGNMPHARGPRPNQRMGYGNGMGPGPGMPFGPYQGQGARMWGYQQQVGMEQRRNKKTKRKEKGGKDRSGQTGSGRGRGVTLEHDEPATVGKATEDETSKTEDPVTANSDSTSTSPSSSDEEGVAYPGEQDVSVSPGKQPDFGTEFHIEDPDLPALSDPVSSYHEGGYELPGVKQGPYNGDSVGFEDPYSDTKESGQTD
ncbi:constitutive coactivator of PPAR-gamma-like protein 1 homolog isoform X1 [Diadema setosum]|uniref:constitutive coactivator of PPAR-gamma-like protein 1 homolog isoform X1 n=1 Tax=Diadema setosum TaxID=31175 RepID=UPI003B3A608C